MQVLHSRCEQKPNTPFTLADAMVKLDHAWKDYKRSAPNSDWTQLIHPETKEKLEAPRHQIESMQEALDRFIFIEAGNRIADLKRHPTHAVLGIEEFKNSYKNIFIGDFTLPTKWLINRTRQTVRDTIYWPNAKRVMAHQFEKFYNMYMQSDQKLPTTLNPAKVELFAQHIMYLFPEVLDRERFLNWMAFTVQRPDIRIPWFPLIISAPGCGKGFIYQVMTRLLGRHNCALIRNKDLESSYNGYMSGTTLVCMDDLVNNKNKRIIEIISPLITEIQLTINHKYGACGDERIFCNFLGFTNNRDAATITLEDRRFWVYEVMAKKRSAQYYTALFNWLKTDGPAHLELWIRQRDIKSFEYAAAPPVTEAKKVMVEAAQGVVERLVRDSIEDRTGVFQCDILDASLVEDFIQLQLGLDRLTERDLNEISKIFSNLSFKLPQDRYRVTLTGEPVVGNKRRRLRSVRRPEHWLEANPNQIADEYRRAWMIGAGREAPAQLKEVKDGN